MHKRKRSTFLGAQSHHTPSHPVPQPAGIWGMCPCPMYFQADWAQDVSCSWHVASTSTIQYSTGCTTEAELRTADSYPLHVFPFLSGFIRGNSGNKEQDSLKLALGFLYMQEPNSQAYISWKPIGRSHQHWDWQMLGFETVLCGSDNLQVPLPSFLLLWFSVSDL